ncbi:zymogen granule protein 16 homolog B-like [Bos javanicus]|uniref:zymogen granule protein 16 homolog B-like n=1 Tax=Bos javanicus TaxID=9906 RepID=UPI002AA74648|nr:zymogen granule protein 16 homolog B-like [Bos javanicus]
MAQEGIKGPVADIQVPKDRLRRPGKAPPPPCLGPRGQGRPLSEIVGLCYSPREPLNLQPEAMLLWLTLAFLWSPTCWAQQKYGPGGGTYFSTSRDFQNDITGIRVFIGPLGLIKSIQVRFGSSWSEKYGAPGGTPQEVILLPEEHITGIYGSYKNFLRHLVIYTDRGRLFPFGKEDGNTFIAFPDESDKVLIGVCGHYKLLGITSIGFEWGYPSFLNK